MYVIYVCVSVYVCVCVYAYVYKCVCILKLASSLTRKSKTTAKPGMWFREDGLKS